MRFGALRPLGLRNGQVIPLRSIPTPLLRHSLPALEMLRISLFGPPNRRIQPERYAQCFLNFLEIFIGNGIDKKFGMRDNENMTGQKFHPGPPYFYKCLKCGHEFSVNRQILVFCPKCKSLKVISNFKIIK
jgi:hypothetical protein